MQDDLIDCLGTIWDYKIAKKDYLLKQHLGYINDLYKVLNKYLENNFAPYVKLCSTICVEHNNQKYLLRKALNESSYSFSFYEIYFGEKDVSQLLRLSITGNEVKTVFVTDDIDSYLQLDKLKNGYVSREEIIEMINNALVDFKVNEQEEKSNQKTKKL